jgi:spore maturation protein CgeB
MKIAIIGSKGFDGLEFHLHDELIFLGIHAKIFDYETYLPKKIDFGLSYLSMLYDNRKNKNLLNAILLFQPDLVIGVYRHINPFVIKTIKEEKIRVIHINPDQLTTLQNQQIFTELYDTYYTKDPYMFRFMKNNLKLNVKLYNEAFNPRFHRRPEVDLNLLERELNIDVLCFGNLYPYRNRMLQLLKAKGFDITIYGNKARYFDQSLNENYRNRGIYGEEKVKILNGAKVVFNNLHYAEVESVNNKFFEISGSGAFQICDYRPILNDLLPIDPNLVSFRNIDEAEKLIRYYLNSPEKRNELRDVIQSHFLENFTYSHLINFILE